MSESCSRKDSGHFLPWLDTWDREVAAFPDRLEDPRIGEVYVQPSIQLPGKQEISYCCVINTTESWYTTLGVYLCSQVSQLVLLLVSGCESPPCVLIGGQV